MAPDAAAPRADHAAHAWSGQGQANATSTCATTSPPSVVLHLSSDTGPSALPYHAQEQLTAVPVADNGRAGDSA